MIAYTWPVADLVEEGITGASGSDGLSVSNQPVVGGNVSQRDTAADQLLGSITSGRIRDAVGERADHTHADRAIIVAGCVCSLTAPAASLVRGTILTDQEVVTDVSPTVTVHVEGLDVAHLLGTGRIRGAVRTGRMMHHDPRSRADRELGGAGSTGSPLGAGHNARTLGRYACQADGGQHQHGGELKGGGTGDDNG
uniref:Uncharacterized protein n=1 Tax=Anopheles culicifacies TaxID=139723 RepID=A0A182LY64_9DIPT